MTFSEIFLLLLDDERRAAGVGGAAGGIVREWSPDRSECRIVFCDAPDEDLARVVVTEAACAREQRYALEWKVYGHDRSATVMSALLGAGFEPGDLETVLGIELHAPRETGGLPPGVEIRIVRDPRELADVSAISRALGRRNVEGETRALATALHDRPSAISVHVLYEDDNPAACGRIHYGRVPGVAELAGGRTVPSQRRRGFFRALVESRLREAAAQGSRYVFVDALPSSHHILTRLGFAAVTTTQPYIYPA